MKFKIRKFKSFLGQELFTIATCPNNLISWLYRIFDGRFFCYEVIINNNNEIITSSDNCKTTSPFNNDGTINSSFAANIDSISFATKICKARFYG